ncbi:MAG: ABC transporter substrate-binding protein, partial [Oscillospiraceae bacterium]|nr:ABC transporter substrate-binding protein [Oscillospiraceae bacterium]
MKRKIAFILLAAFLLAALCGCAGAGSAAAEAEKDPPQTRTFTDSLGRTVTLPVTVSGVAVSGPLAQTYVFPLCPDLL